MENIDLLFVQESGRGPTHGRTRSRIRAHVMDKVIAGRKADSTRRLNVKSCSDSFREAFKMQIVDQDRVDGSQYHPFSSPPLLHCFPLVD